MSYYAISRPLHLETQTTLPNLAIELFDKVYGWNTYFIAPTSLAKCFRDAISKDPTKTRNLKHSKFVWEITKLPPPTAESWAPENLKLS